MIALVIGGGYSVYQSLFTGPWFSSIQTILKYQQLLTGASLIGGAVLIFFVWCFPDLSPESWSRKQE